MEILLEEGLQNIAPFLGNLEWMYIISFIILCYAWQRIESKIEWDFIKKIKKRFQVAILGLFYAPVYYLLWGLDKTQIGSLLTSFLVSFAFHKLLVDVIIGAIKAKIRLFAVNKIKGGNDE